MTSTSPHSSKVLILTENAVQWTRWLKGFSRKLRFFRISKTQDKLDALFIYGGHDIENLLETLPDPTGENVVVPEYARAEGEAINEYHIQVAKLHAYFCTSANKDSARAKFDTMTQGDKLMSQYHVDLRKQEEKCKFPDIDDAIRSKILQTMTDKKLRREAMLKSFNLMKLLQEAGNRKDVERQAREIEKIHISEDVHQIYSRRRSQNSKSKKFKPKTYSKPQSEFRDKRLAQVQILW